MAGTAPEKVDRPTTAASPGGRRRRPRLGIRIDMTPMVDVAFLLLIFFMVTTVFRQPLAMEINMPEPGARVEVPESNVLTIFVNDDDRLFAKTGKEVATSTTWEVLPDLFVQGVTENPALIVLVKIHPEARYERMVDMMDLLDDVGMERFSLVRMDEADMQALEELQ